MHSIACWERRVEEWRSHSKIDRDKSLEIDTRNEQTSPWYWWNRMLSFSRRCSCSRMSVGFTMRNALLFTHFFGTNTNKGREREENRSMHRLFLWILLSKGWVFSTMTNEIREENFENDELWTIRQHFHSRGRFCRYYVSTSTLKTLLYFHFTFHIINCVVSMFVEIEFYFVINSRESSRKISNKDSLTYLTPQWFLFKWVWWRHQHTW